MSTLHACIHGYHVELDPDMEGHGAQHPARVSGCWISLDRFCASLEAADATGELVDSVLLEKTIPISGDSTAAIRAWAVAHGY